MAHFRTLKPEERQRLQQWLDEEKIELNNRTRRELSDVVTMAQLFKKAHNRLVDLQNFSSRNSFELKLQNWEAFNLKVLRKLGLTLSRQMLELLARGELAAIEQLLYELVESTNNTGRVARRLSRARSPKPAQVPAAVEATNNTDGGDEQPTNVLLVDVVQMVNGKCKKVPQKMVYYETYLELKRLCTERENYLNSLLQKAQYLEGIIDSKEERITELTTQLAKLSASVLSKQYTLCGDEAENVYPWASCAESATELEM